MAENADCVQFKTFSLHITSLIRNLLIFRKWAIFDFEGASPPKNYNEVKGIQGAIMNADNKAQWHAEGSKMIIDYCKMMAGMIGINLKKVYWTAENPGDERLIKHILTIEAENGAIQLLFGVHDIATFPTKADYAERTQKKLKKALFGFRTNL